MGSKKGYSEEFKQNGWWSIDEYSKYINKAFQIDMNFIEKNVLSDQISYGALSPQDFCYVDKSRMIIAQQIEMSESPRAIAMITINKYFLKEYLREKVNEELIRIDIVNSKGDLLIDYKIPSPNKVNYKIAVPCSSLLISFNTYFSISPYKLTFANVLTFGLFALLTIILTAVIAYILSTVSYSPLSQLINKISLRKGNSTDSIQSDYQFIEDSIQILYDENINMQNSVAIYKAAAKKSLYIQLLKGYFEKDNLRQTLAQYDIAYTNEKYYAVILICIKQLLEITNDNETVLNKVNDETKAKILIAAEYAIKEIGFDAAVIDTLDNNIAVILCFDEKISTTENLYECAKKINNNIYQLSTLLIDSSVSSVHKGIVGISVAYQEAKDNGESYISNFDKTGVFMAGQTKNMYYYPTDWEHQLILNLKTGNLSVVKSILKEIEVENKRLSLSRVTMARLNELVSETILRVSFEMHINSNEIFEHIEKSSKKSENYTKWQSLYDVAFYICEKITSKNIEMIKDINSDILEYINQNYSNPEISLKTISGMFNISIASVSRIFKDVTDINFLDYVTSLRMEKAKQLLKTCGYDITNISKAVGYDSEYSFKRAFLRVVGTKPKEFADQHKRTAISQ